ncbi:hydroxyacyl-coenzyme A dehydrogenase, mitochondrial-like [Bradysia coprophila]|uniref:hydroxyacyl-coenzyme A dehydrogenase, mitochondrial-like n=1 Tax=Bradysia coprophila TaxID=38358 RepID=UPI00187D7FB6|nr:hydroxyacyl-coenzyme A dehydrogenase, mitochondrial-like [Bradysia coprophila]
MSRESSVNIKNVTVFGGGVMGSGIAFVVAAAGYNVTLTEVSQQLAEQSKKNVMKTAERVARKKFANDEKLKQNYVQDTMSRIDTSFNYEKSVKNADLVIEAIVEDLGAKHKLFSLIDKVAPQHTIFTSNTSSLLIKEIASVTTRLDRFGGLHFFNPVPVMKLLEIISTDESSSATNDTLKMFGKSIGKTCVSCKDAPGFIVNRLLIPYSSEAIKLLEEGVATAEDIDVAMKLGAGYPMGPFELADLVGLDVMSNIRKGWCARFPTKYQPSKLVDKMVSEGKLGIKTGEGFYKYNM